MLKIVVTSKNPVKIEATKLGFEKMFPDIEYEVETLSVSSDVSDQPKSSKETYQGALNRVNNAAQVAEADYYIGIEGGIEDSERGMEVLAWIVIRSQDGKYGAGRTTSFYLPESVRKIIHEGKELGDACDLIFNESNMKQKEGTVGILTANNITRTKYYIDPVIMALIPFKNPDLY